MSNKRLPLLTDRRIKDLSTGYDWDIHRPIAEQWPWCGEADPIAAAKLAVAVIEPPRATADAFAPEDSATTDPWQATPETRSTPVAVPIVTGSEPESGVEVVAADCPREECATGCVALYGGCVVETEEPAP